MRSLVVIGIAFVLLSGACSQPPVAAPTAESTAADSQSESGSPPSTPTLLPAVVVPTAAADRAVITGRIVSAGDGDPITGTSVWLAWVYWFDESHSDGTFNLDPSSSPTAFTDSEGRFAIGDVPPREYSVIVGDPMGANYIVANPDGSVRVFALAAGQTMDVGDLLVDLARPSQVLDPYPPVTPLYP